MTEETIEFPEGTIKIQRGDARTRISIMLKPGLVIHYAEDLGDGIEVVVVPIVIGKVS